MPTVKRFSSPLAAVINAAKIVGVRAGVDDHRFLAIWVVVVDGRVFVRPWNNKTGGWHEAFLGEPRGDLQVGDRTIRVHARKTRGERLLDAIDLAYATKYPTPASRKWVRGFATPRRRATTLELVPR
ncbi:MAG: DUF2255 family protein [Gemmatimonadetes bacterium]|nr:DUF2255 family protein [Gemmatimonadota bacterium]